jgi:hypothetical protein
MTDNIILSYALIGAYECGRNNGKTDCMVGQKFRSAFAAADEAGLTAKETLMALRNMFVHGYLEVLPAIGVKTNEDGIVLAEKSESRPLWLSKCDPPEKEG